MQPEFLQIVLTFSPTPGKSDWPVSRVSGDGANAVTGHHQNHGSDTQQAVASISQMPQLVLHHLLSVLTADGVGEWQRYDAIHAIEWFESGPQFFPDAASPRHSYCRNGRLTLPGFGEVELPARDIDGACTFRLGNEGECSLTLFGDAETVHELVLVKYYPSEDATSLVIELLQGKANAQLLEVADREPAEVICQIQCPDGGIAYAAITNEEGGRNGPGFTTFVLTKTDPRARGD